MRHPFRFSFLNVRGLACLAFAGFSVGYVVAQAVYVLRRAVGL